jgi:phosphoglycolate phosphatase
MTIETIIWDWNGTLLNDSHLSLSTINRLLKERNLKTLSHEQYLEVFTFPVIDYYRTIGFDFEKEPFELPANQYIDIYNNAVDNCGLHTGVIESLARFSSLGIRQFILSAMEQQQLNRTVMLNRIHHFFEAVAGLDNHYAVSKIEVGHKLIDSHNLNLSKTLLIGDTIHDFEVAQSLGCQCLLIANGHQSAKRLERTGAKVVKNLSEIVL